MALLPKLGLVGQADARLGEVHEIAGRVLGIGVDVQPDATAHPGALQGPDSRGQGVAIGGVIDRGHFVVQRLQADALDGLLVEEAGVEVTDALLVGPGSGALLTGFDDQLAHLLLGAVEQVAKCAVGRPVRGYVVFLQPATIDVAEQVVLRTGIRIYMAQVDTRANSRIRHPAIFSPHFKCDDRAMPDDAAADTAKDSDPDSADSAPAATEGESSGEGMFSSYGVGSAFLGVLSVAAVVLGVLIWIGHRDEISERVYLTRVMQAAAEWTDVLINMNAGNIDSSLQQLHDGTVGQLNTDFDAAVQPYRQVVEKLQTHSSGRIEAVAIETVHRDLDTRPGTARPVVTTKLPLFASRTDSVLLVATSVAENAGVKPQTVHWSLRVEVSDVDGKLLVSGLASIR